MLNKPFDEKELTVVKEFPNFFGGTIPVYDFLVTMKENMNATILKREPVWMLTDVEMNMFCPEVIPDNGARDYVSRCTKPGKLAVSSMYNGSLFASPIFRAEVYRASRERYAG